PNRNSATHKVKLLICYFYGIIWDKNVGVDVFSELKNDTISSLCLVIIWNYNITISTIYDILLFIRIANLQF
ncbi:MAG TPA: hypothetical protein PLJ85_05215, partial [Candidatus Cloacimonas sp.]|nr:hypothetical protein [Candidatus Cloacimonas sp.]